MLYNLRFVLRERSHSITLLLCLVWPHQLDNLPGRPRALRIAVVHEEAHPSFLILFKHPLNALMLEAPTARWSSRFHQLITPFEKIQQSCVYRNLASFQECSLVPLLLSSKVKSSFSLSLDSPLHILNISMRSCLFILSSSDHYLNQCNLSSYVFPSIFLITFVNLWTFSISCLYFIQCWFQALLLYSTRGLTSVLYKRSITLVSLNLIDLLIRTQN